MVFGFKGRHISNRANVRKPIKHFTGGEAMSFWGAVLILSSAMGRHLFQGNLVSFSFFFFFWWHWSNLASKTNLVSWFLRVWFFGQKNKGFKVGSWVLIKQQHLTILCSFLPLVLGLSSQYFNNFLRGLSGYFILGLCFLSPLFAAFISHFSLLVNCALSIRSLIPFPLALELSCTLILFCFVCLQPHHLWELEAPLGSHQYKLLTWIRIKSLTPP
jgi:hypothetical protein